MSCIRDIAMAPSSEMKIKWVERNMPVLRGIGEEFTRTRPFAGMKIALSVHLEAKTAYLCRVLEMGGAEMYVTGSNPLSTQDDVAAALAAGGMQVFAEYGCTTPRTPSRIRRVTGQRTISTISILKAPSRARPARTASFSTGRMTP